MIATEYPCELSDADQTSQSVRAIALSNRLTMARIRLKRASRLSDDLAAEIRTLDRTIFSVSDSLILGEDVSGHLDMSEKLVAELEQRIQLTNSRWE